MGLGDLNPGCGCCESPYCIYEDEFDTGDTSDLATYGDYTERAGNWDIANEELHVGSSSALLEYSTTDGDFPNCESSIVQVDAKGDDDGDELLLVSQWSGTTPTVYLELTVGASATLRWKDIYGNDVSVDVTAAAGEFHTLKLVSCYGCTGLFSTVCSMLRIYLNGTLIMYGVEAITEFIDRSNWSLGTGSISNDAYFDNIWTQGQSTILGTPSDCEDADENTCPDCPTESMFPVDKAPDEIDITISGVANGGIDSCTECAADINDTFTVQKVDTPTFTTGTNRFDNAPIVYELTGLNLLSGCSSGSGEQPPITTIVLLTPVPDVDGGICPDYPRWVILFLNASDEVVFRLGLDPPLFGSIDGVYDATTAFPGEGEDWTAEDGGTDCNWTSLAVTLA